MGTFLKCTGMGCYQADTCLRATNWNDATDYLACFGKPPMQANGHCVYYCPMWQPLVPIYPAKQPRPPKRPKRKRLLKLGET